MVDRELFFGNLRLKERELLAGLLEVPSFLVFVGLLLEETEFFRVPETGDVQEMFFRNGIRKVGQRVLELVCQDDGLGNLVKVQDMYKEWVQEVERESAVLDEF